MVKKRKIWDIANVITTLKAFVVGLIFMVIYFIISWTITLTKLAPILYIVLFIAGLWLWGFLANRFWGWK